MTRGLAVRWLPSTGAVALIAAALANSHHRLNLGLPQFQLERATGGLTR